MTCAGAPEGGEVTGGFVGTGAAVVVGAGVVALCGADVAALMGPPSGNAPPLEAEPPPQAASDGKASANAKHKACEALKDFITPLVVGLNAGSLKLLAIQAKEHRRRSEVLLMFSAERPDALERDCRCARRIAQSR
jgi:hypothetical protein